MTEALAIIEALKKWKHYFAGSSIVIRTDQQSLRYIQEKKLTESIQHKLLVKLLGYDYRIEYKKGRENKAADALSRAPDMHTTMAITAAVPKWITDVTNSYATDTYCKELIAKLTVDSTATPNYTLKNGILRYKQKLVVGSDTALQTQIITSLHDSAFGAHSGETATYHRVKLVFHWTCLKKYVISYVKECAICEKNKAEHTPYPGLLKPLRVPDKAWTHVSMDFIEGLPKSEGKYVILVVVDRFTKYSHCLPLSHPFTVKQVADLYLDQVSKLHGPPAVIVSDRDRIFTSGLWQDFFKAIGVKLHLSTAYHPQTDGQTE
jgi:hypothetical protein